MFGLGMQEFVLLALVGFLMVIPVVIVVALLRWNQTQIAGRIEELEAENRELREKANEPKAKE